MTINGFLGKAAWAFIPGMFFIICPWFAGYMTTGITEVSYEVSKKSLNGLTSVFINLTNIDNASAVDKLELSVPAKNVLYSSLSEEKNNIKISNWNGSLSINKSIELLMVMDTDMNVDHNFVSSIFKGMYQKRDDVTGNQKWVNVKLSEKGMIALNKSTLSIIWYFIPLLISLLIAIIVIKVMNKNTAEVQA